MKLSSNERALLPLIGLQGAVTSLNGFIGFFIMGAHNVHALFRFTAAMLTAAVAATFLAYVFGPRLRLNGRRLFRLGLLLPGLLLLFGKGTVPQLAIAFGGFLGLTWGARHALEMSLFQDGERDAYAVHSGTVTVVVAVAATMAATLVLYAFGEQSGLLYRLYGAASVLGALLFGRTIPDTPPVYLDNPLGVIRQPQFLACLPLFFLESGLFGIGQAMSSAGAVKALGSASHFGWVATGAGLVGAIALYLTRRRRGVQNRADWLGASCLVVGLSFVLLGLSVWLPALYVAYSILKAAGAPFLSASEQVLNQRTLDIQGALPDRIFARELVLWILRMLSLCGFWMLANAMPARHMVVAGALLLAAATAMEYLVGKTLFNRNALEQPA